MRPSGQLRRGTLAEVLLEAEQNVLSGAIAVISDDRQGKVYLREGRITHARQSVQREFDEWLGLLGLVPADDPTIATTLAERLDTDLAINAPMIKRLGREYVDRVCADLLRLEEGDFRIQEGEQVPHGVIESWKVAQVLLNAAATGHADKLEMRPSAKDVRLKATTEPQVVLTRAEWRLAVEMSRPASPELLAEAVGAEPRSVRRVLNGLLERDLLIAGPAARLTPPPEQTSPSAPATATAPAAPTAPPVPPSNGRSTSGTAEPATPASDDREVVGPSPIRPSPIGSPPIGSSPIGPSPIGPSPIARTSDGEAVYGRGDGEPDTDERGTGTETAADGDDDTDALPRSKRATALRRLMSQMRE